VADEKFRVLARNRRARFNYEILETVEAGIVLRGTEIKSIRDGRVSLQEAYGRYQDGELWLLGMHVAPYPGAGPFNQHDPHRPKKLLMHRREIRRLGLTVERERLTLVPLRLYIKGHRAKVELALARGRARTDRRQVIREREARREMGRAQRRQDRG
jgi:SsrA-binding protein